jgi:hypothetical protein
MKKILLSACAILVASATFAQLRVAEMLQRDVAKQVTNVSTPINPFTSAVASAPIIIHSDDFSNAGNWVIDHDQNACSLDWQIGSNSCTGSYPTDDILSTTASNGWAMIDSDAYGGATGGTEVEDCWLTMATPVDLNGYPNVNVEFESNYRSYNSELPYIVVGIGDGQGNVTWPDLDPLTDISLMSNVFIPFPGYASGDATTNPELIAVNISPALVGLTSIELADIYIRFHWTGTWGYAWFIDDLSISETADNAISCDEAVTGGYWIDYQSYSASGLNTMIGLDYTVTPVDQVNVRPFSCEAVIMNTGVSSQSAILKYDVTGSATYSGSSVATVLASSDVATVAATPTFSPGIGNYVVEMWAEADSAGAGLVITNSDIQTRNIEVSQYLYGKDEGATNQAGAYDVGDDDDENQISTRYEIYANADLYSLRVFIDDGSTVGAKIYAVIYESDSTATDGVFFLDQSDDYTLTAQDLGNWVDVSFLNPISLFAGYAYEFGVGGYQHPTDISLVGSTANTSLYNGEHSSFDVTGLSTQSAGSPTWYYITSTPMVRMNFEPIMPSAISEFGVSMFDVYPNPSLGSFSISLEESGEFAVSVINVLGKTVYATVIDSKLTKVNLTGISKGVYTVELSSGDVLYTEKLIIE